MLRLGLFVAAVLVPAVSAQVNIPQPVLSGTGVLLDRLGSAVASDDSTIVVGATGGQFGAAGYALVHEKVGGVWTMVKKWSPPGQKVDSEFGLDLDVEGDVIVAGAPKQGPGGRVYVLERIGGVWTQMPTLQSPEADTTHRFGAGVSLSGNRLLVGHEGAGHAHLFEKQGGTWTPVAVLTPSVVDASFGQSVALDGDLAAVGAPKEDTMYEDAGVVYTFDFDGNAWSETQRIVTNTGSGLALMGWALDLEGDRLAIGAPNGWSNPDFKGNVRIYGHNTNGNWGLKQTLSPKHDSFFGEFGYGLDLDGSRILVGATGWGGGPPGRAFLYQANGAGTFQPVIEFRGPGGVPDDGVGKAVALSGDTAAIGIYETSIPGGYQLLNLADPTWQDIGSAMTPPSGGNIPRFYGFGTLQAGSPGSLELDCGWNTQPAVLLVAVGAPSPVPFHGGTLQAFPAALVLSLKAGNTNQVVVPFHMPPGISGLSFVAQFALVQKFQFTPVKYALSNAIVGQVP